MDPFKRQTAIDLTRFDPGSNAPDALYGLPQDVAFCTKCVISNQRPSSSIEFQHSRDEKKSTIQLDEDGICDACHFAERKMEIDWDKRETTLRDLCDQHRRADGLYDCLVAGSGGKDGFYASWLLKHKYGMHPLTVTWAPHLHTDWGWRNFQGWMHSGFDNLLFTPNGRTHRLLTRLAFEILLHPFQPFILGQKNYPPRAALQNGIKLVFFGENEAEYGNPVKENLSAKRDWKYFVSGDRTQIFLGGASLADLEKHFGLEEADFSPYLPTDPATLQDAGIEVHYMGYYEKWHPQGAYYHAVEHGNFQASPERTPGTYSKYNSIDDKIDDLHYFTTWIKFGIGRATYDAAQEARNEDITRDEAVALARRFDGEIPERFFDELLQYLSLPDSEFPIAAKMFEQPTMDRDYFFHLCDRFRSPHLWKWSDGHWSLRSTSWSP